MISGKVSKSYSQMPRYQERESIKSLISFVLRGLLQVLILTPDIAYMELMLI
jgi:hypothetical protein